jgi:hypothetical protein
VAIAGRVLLTADGATVRDDRIVGLAGMGGQGVLAVPVPYHGWVQQLPGSLASIGAPRLPGLPSYVTVKGAKPLASSGSR